LSGDRSVGWLLKGTLYREWARWRETRGKSPLDDYASAEAAFRRAIESDPRATQAWSGLATAKMGRADIQGHHGSDPLPDYASAEQDFQELIRVERHTSDPWLKRGQLYEHRALYRLERGEMPLDDLSRAEDDLSEAIRLNSAADMAYAERGAVRVQIGRLREKTPDPAGAARAYGEAEADYARGLALNPLLEAEFGTGRREGRERLRALTPGK
jgi:tetratricopeptide (TPR) repeat protein